MPGIGLNSEPSCTTLPPSMTLPLCFLITPTNSQDRAIRFLRESASGGSVAAKHQLGLDMIHMSRISPAHPMRPLSCWKKLHSMVTGNPLLLLEFCRGMDAGF